MAAKILVVDDVAFNVKLLTTKLTQEYYNVVTAQDGIEAIQKAKEENPDIILMDIMMPNMDGFEATKIIKSTPEISHIPVIMVTALDAKEDKVNGLKSGANDFLTKPINDYALIIRIKSLLRLKMITDQLRLRDQTSIDLGLSEQPVINLNESIKSASVLLIDDDSLQAKKITNALSDSNITTNVMENETDLLPELQNNNYDLIIINSQLLDIDPLSLCSQIKGIESLRTVPVMMIHDEENQDILIKALEIGINDYISVPIHSEEIEARAITQIKQKQYQDLLRSNYIKNVSLSMVDELTGLHNRRYFENHIHNMIAYTKHNDKDLSLMVLDIDHFKAVNDTYGHQAGDKIIKDVASRIMKNIRSTDMCARYGGEEFIIALPDTNIEQTMIVANRIKNSISNIAFGIDVEPHSISCTISIGVSVYKDERDLKKLIKIADDNLYQAKEGGRNLVICEE